MLGLSDLKRMPGLVDQIDWEMTPHEAVTLYLEWGNNWAHGTYVIRSKEDEAHYFVVNTWKDRPIIYLVRRNSEMAEELAEIELPSHLAADFMDSVGGNKGVYALDEAIRRWLEAELAVG